MNGESVYQWLRNQAAKARAQEAPALADRFSEAADEIEQLRARLDKLRHYLDAEAETKLEALRSQIDGPLFSQRALMARIADGALDEKEDGRAIDRLIVRGWVEFGPDGLRLTPEGRVRL